MVEDDEDDDGLMLAAAAAAAGAPIGSSAYNQMMYGAAGIGGSA